jgi:hypothetical protein
MHFSTAIMALAATAGLVAAQNKCDAQKYVSKLQPLPTQAPPKTHNLTLNQQHRRRLRLRLQSPHRRLQRQRQRLHLPVRRLHRRPRLLQQLPQLPREAARREHRYLLLQRRPAAAPGRICQRRLGRLGSRDAEQVRAQPDERCCGCHGFVWKQDEWRRDADDDAVYGGCGCEDGERGCRGCGGACFVLDGGMDDG